MVPLPPSSINGEINSFREDLDRGGGPESGVNYRRNARVKRSIFSLSLSLWNGKVHSSKARPLIGQDSKHNLEAEFRIGVPSRDASLHDGSTTVE